MVQDHQLAISNEVVRNGPDLVDSSGKQVGLIESVPRVQTYAVTVLRDEHTEAVILEFENPSGR